MATDLRSTSPDGYAAFDEYIEFQLGKTKSNIKWTEIGMACLWVAIALLGYLLLFAIFDQWVIPGGFGIVPRAVMLVLLVGGTGYAIVRHIVIPGAKRVHGLYAAKIVEQADPDLKSALLNYVDLQRSGQPVPPAVLKAIEKRTAVTLAKFDVDLAVDRRPLLRFSYVLMAIIVAFGLYAILSPKDVMQSVRRALLPAAPTPAPTMTVIANVMPGRTALPARSPLVVEADIQGKVPENVNLIYTTADRNIVDEVIEMRKMEDGLPRYRGTLLGENGRGLLQNITYRIVAGDARTEDYDVTVIQPPSARVDAVAYAYPPYMELEPKTLPGGPIDAWDGTTVTVSATANMPVTTAYVALLDIEDAHAKGEEIPAKIVDGTKIQAQWKLEFRSDGTAPRFYMLRVKTEKGETDPDPTLYSLKIRPDLPPEVTLVSPTGDLTRPANATIPLLIQASDPDFKLRSLTLRGTYQQGAERFDERLFEDKPLGQSFKGAHDLALEPLKLKTGDKVQFWIEARDNRQPTANARSTPKIEVTIIDPVPPEQAKDQHEKDKQEQQKQEQEKNNPDEPQPEQQKPNEQPQEQKPEENPEQQPGEKSEKPKGSEKGPPGEKSEGAPSDENKGEGEPGDGSQEPPKADGSEDEQVLENLLNREQQKPRRDPPPRPSSSSEQEQNPDQNPPQQPQNPDQPQNDQRGNDSKTSRTGSKGSQQKKPEQGTQDPRPPEQPQDDQTPQPGDSTKQEPPKGNDSKTGSPKAQPKPGETSPPEQKPSESPMPGTSSDMTDTPKEPGPAQKPQPGEKGNDTGTKPEQRPQPGSEKPEPQKGAEKGSNEKVKDPAGQKPMPGEQRPQPSGQKPEKIEGEPEKGTDAQPKPGEKQPGQPMPMDAKPEDGMPGAQEKPQEGAPMTGAEKPGAKDEPGDKPAGDDMPPMGDKGQPGQASRQEKPGENPQADPNPDGQGGTPTNTKNPAGEDQKGEPGKPNAQAPKKGEDPGKATDPIPGGEEKPADDSPDAREEKATGMEEGPAEGADKPDPNAVRAQKPIEKKPGEQGVRQPGEQKPGEKTPMTDPNRKGNDAGASDTPEKAKPATSQKTKNEPPQNPDGVDSERDPAKNPDRPREQRPGQPDAGNEDLKGQGRKQGQKSEQPDGGEAGSSKTADKGTQGSDERGPGDTDTEPGDAEKSEKPAGGKPSTQKGNGEQTAPSKTGSKPGEKGTGQKPSEGGQPSQGKGSETAEGLPQGEPGEPGDSTSSESGKGVRGKDDKPSNNRRPGREGGGPTERRDAELPEAQPATDDPGEANLRKNRDASNLVLRRLKDELARGDVDPDLLKQLGWSKENLEQFVERMEQKLNDAGEDNSPEGLARRKRFEEFLRSLSVGEKTERRQAGTRATRLSPNIQSNSVVPPEYRDQVEAYTKSLAK